MDILTTILNFLQSASTDADSSYKEAKEKASRMSDAELRKAAKSSGSSAKGLGASKAYVEEYKKRHGK